MQRTEAATLRVSTHSVTVSSPKPAFSCSLMSGLSEGQTGTVGTEHGDLISEEEKPVGEAECNPKPVETLEGGGNVLLHLELELPPRRQSRTVCPC